ncbi:MAG: hypothetical protein EPO26_08700 [Chloroflexota bacterium]|nr:MAG: hypothetical protein EPO26_08700 [Chloroflexota bacterium]
MKPAPSVRHPGMMGLLVGASLDERVACGAAWGVDSTPTAIYRAATSPTISEAARFDGPARRVLVVLVAAGMTRSDLRARVAVDDPTLDALLERLSRMALIAETLPSVARPRIARRPFDGHLAAVREARALVAAASKAR